jgi:hypothetical protein
VKDPFLFRNSTNINPLNDELNPICHLLVLLRDLTFMGPCIVSIFQYSNIYPTRCNVIQFIYILKLLYMFRVVLRPINRSSYKCTYSIWYLSHRYCYLLLAWKHVEQFPDINKLCNFVSCWIYIGILLGAHYIYHISRIRVNNLDRKEIQLKVQKYRPHYLPSTYHGESSQPGM